MKAARNWSCEQTAEALMIDEQTLKSYLGRVDEEGEHAGRVEDWRGDGRSSLVCVRGFPLRARLGLSMIPFPAPATSHAACEFPALRAPARFWSRVMGPIMLEQLSAQDDSAEPCNRRTSPGCCISNAYSTVSNRNPGAIEPGSGGAESSARPSS